MPDRAGGRGAGSGSAVARFARGGNGWLLAIALLAPLLHLVTSGLLKLGYGYFIDEFYYIACSKRLAFGYVDHPPLSIWLLALSRALIGESLPALRLLPAIAVAATVFLTGRMARMLGCGVRGQVLAALAVLVAPAYVLIGGFYSMNPFELLIWTACGCLVIQIMRDDGRDPRGYRDRAKRWLSLGLLVGVGLEFKHTMILYVVALLIGWIVSPSRRVLRTKHLIFGGLIAIAILLPNLIWQAQHGLPSLEFYRNAILLKNAPTAPIDVVLEQVLLMNPIALPLWLLGLWFCLVCAEGRPYRAFGWSYLVLILIMVASRSSRPDRIIAAYPILFAAGARAVELLAAARGVAGRRSWSARVAIPAIAAGGIVLGPIVTPVLPPAMLVKYMKALGMQFEIERGKTAKLPQWFADRFGWEERVAEVGRVWATLPPDDRKHAVVVGGNYGQAGSLEFYGPRYGLGRVISTHNNYFLWGPGEDSIQVVVAVLVSREDLEEAFEDVRQVGFHECEYCMDYQSRLPVFVARNPRYDLRAVWPELKHFE
jgi:hypothetical protein